MKYLRNLVVLVSVLVFILVSDIYATKEVCIVNFNDFHSMIYQNKTYNDVPGMVFFMNAILSEIKKHGKDNVILVSGGDNYHGTIVSDDTKGAPVSDMFRELGVAFSAVGNHVFDWGTKIF
jgi:2',3'-cyclic-nucleotide 2'-phosphodiesterase/3'-nucleotidase/5'-nucleotidase